VEYKDRKDFNPSQPSWNPTPEIKWLPNGERDYSGENQSPYGEHYNPYGESAYPPKSKKKAKADPAQQPDSTQAKPDDKPQESASALFGLKQEHLEQQVGSASSSKESQADDIAKAATSEPIKESSDKTAQSKPPTPTAEDHSIPGLPKQGGTAIPKDNKAQFEPKVGNLDDVQVHRAPKHAKALGAQAFTVGRHVYMGEGADNAVLNHELGHFAPNDKASKKIRRKAPDDSWAIRQAELRRQQAAARAAEKERQRKAAEAEAKRKAKIEADRKIALAKQAADAAALKKGQDGKSHRTAAIAQLKHKNLLAIQKKNELKNQPKSRPKTDLSTLKEQVRLHKEQKQQAKQAKLQTALQKHPGVQNVLGGALALGAGLMNPAFGAAALAGARNFLATPEKPKAAEPEQKPESKPESKGFFGNALKFGKQSFAAIADVGKTIVETGVKAAPAPLLGLASPALGAAAAFVGGAPATAAPKPQEAPKPEEKKDDGGWFGRLKNAGENLVNGGARLVGGAIDGGRNLVNGAVDAGRTLVNGAITGGRALVNGAREMGQSAINAGRQMVQGAEKWLTENPKAAMALGALAVVGGVALTVATGGLAGVVIGGALMGAGASTLTQGAHIADGAVDPATGKPKTFSLGDVGRDAVIGGATGLVGGPLIKAAFKAAPTVVGGALALGVASGGVQAYNSYKEGNGWTALAEGGLAATAALPFANRRSLTGMFGAQARSQTMQTGAQVWNGARNLGNQAVSGVRNLATSEGLAGVRALGSEAWSGARNLGSQAISGVRGWGSRAWNRIKGTGNQPSESGGIRDVSEQETGTVWGAGPTQTAPKAPTSEPDVGLSNRGYRPQPGERATTREQWKAQSSEQRAASRTSQADQALENPLPNASRHGHGHADHGYQTTDVQQGNRIRTGIPPSGRTNAPAVSKTSKFNSPRSEAEALGRGKGKLETDIANGHIPPDKRFPDPATGKPTYVDPTTGAPTRHKISVTTDDPNGFGYKIVKQRDPITGQILRDAAGQPLTIADPAKINSATIIWEYVPGQGVWHPVTYYPQ
jgi:Domain of unknown function (DUF4157)